MTLTVDKRPTKHSMKRVLGGLRGSTSKFEYVLTIHHLINLKKNGTIMYVSYKCGRNKTGETKKAFVKDKTATFEEDFKFSARMEPKGSSYGKKEVEIMIHDVNSSEGNTVIGRLKFNLAEFTNSEGLSTTRNVTVPLFGKNAELKVKLRCVPAKSSSGTDSTVDSELTLSDERTENEDTAPQAANSPQFNRALRRKVQLDSRMKRMESYSLDFNAEEVSFTDDAEASDIIHAPSALDDIDATNVNSPADVSSGGSPAMSSPQAVPIKRRASRFQAIDVPSPSPSPGTPTSPKERVKSPLVTKSPIVAKSFDADAELDADEEDDDSGGSEEQTKSVPQLSPPVNYIDHELVRREQEERERKAKEEQDTIDRQNREILLMKQRLIQLERQSDENAAIDTLIRTKSPEYDRGYPVSAPILFQICDRFGSFNSEGGGDFLKSISSSIDVVTCRTTDIPLLCYWLGNTCMLLTLLHKEFPVATPNNKQAPANHDDDLSRFEFENPVTRFKGELSQLSFTIYTRMVGMVKEEISPILVGSMFGLLTKAGRLSASNLIRIEATWLEHLKHANIPHEVVRAFFYQINQYIADTVMETLLSETADRCTMGSAINLKMASSEIEEWTRKNALGLCDEMAPVRQSATVMMMNKASLIDEETRRNACPSLTVRKLRQLFSCYKADEYDPESVPQSVIDLLALSESGEEEPSRDKEEIVRPNFLLENELPSWRRVNSPPALTYHKAFAFLNNVQQTM